MKQVILFIKGGKTMDKPIEKYIDSIITGKTNGYGFIGELDDKWIEKLCEIAEVINKENFLTERFGIKKPKDRKEFEKWTLLVTQNCGKIPYDVFTDFTVKVIKYYEKVEKE